MTGPAAPSPFNLADLLRRVEGDHTLLLDIVAVFVEDAPAQLTAIEAAVRSREPRALQAAAHALKGAAAYLAAGAVVRGAQTLESLGRAETMDDAADVLARLRSDLEELVEALRTLQPTG